MNIKAKQDNDFDPTLMILFIVFAVLSFGYVAFASVKYFVFFSRLKIRAIKSTGKWNKNKHR